MQNIRILAKAFFRYFVHKVVPIQNACVRIREAAQPNIYGIGSKVIQFIYTLFINYMPNIWILAKAVLQIFCSQGCSYAKCLCPKKDTLVCNYMPNIRILAKAVLQIFCSQCYSYTKCLCPKKWNNSTENLRNRFKS